VITIEKKWLTKVGGLTVEKCVRDGGKLPNVKLLGSRASLFVPAKGVQHTTEGHWAGSLSRFVNDTGTPTFMMGYETLKVSSGHLTNLPAMSTTRIRIAQFAPIGDAVLTLKNAAGGTETNRECHVQIELTGTCVVGTNGSGPWLPPDPVLKVLADLYKQIEAAIGIPLQRGGNGTRSLARWDGASGWFGHGEVPENDHTDPRSLKYDSIFALASPDLVPYWELRAGGKLLHKERSGVVAGVDALNRMLAWQAAHTAAIRTAEKESGAVKLQRVARAA
jgi:hypothetical protein